MVYVQQCVVCMCSYRIIPNSTISGASMLCAGMIFNELYLPIRWCRLVLGCAVLCFVLFCCVEWSGVVLKIGERRVGKECRSLC